MEQDDLCEIVGCTKLATHKRYKKLWTDVVDDEKRYETTTDELYTTIGQYCKGHYNTEWTNEGLIGKSIK